MITKLDEKIWDVVIKGSRDERLYVFANPHYGFPYFCLYYFPEYFVYKTPDFHWKFFDDCMALLRGELREALWIAFRESAKTTIAKFFVVWCICMKETWKHLGIKPKNYIAWDSYDGTNAESALFDIAIQLQTNRLIVRDFGRLYKKRKHQKTKQDEEEDGPKIKRIGNFLTENKIKVEMFTTQESARGRISGRERPDLFIFDDIENNITKESLALTSKIIRHVDEVNSGLQASGCILFLGNYISEEGVIAYLSSRLTNKKGKIIRNVKVVEKGVPTWPGKYVMTNDEALRKNLELPKEEHRISIEEKRSDLGESVFQTEMMNDPGKSGDYYFDREKVRAAMQKLLGLDRQPVKVVGGFKIWEVYNPLHRYGGGGDTAAGNGGDDNASSFYNFSTKPNRIVGTYKSNEISASAFGAALVKQAQYFGECFIVPEVNNTGYATVAKILELGYWNTYVREVKNKTTQKMQKEWGYYTNESNKYQVAADFKDAWEAGDIDVYDIDLLTEMYHFTKQDLKGLARNSARAVAVQEGVMTRHFDLLKSAFLGWEARSFATKSKEEKKDLYKAPKRPAYEV